MSRFKRLWVLLVPTVMIAGLGVFTPAQASDWPPPAPTPSDVCGTKQDRFYIPATPPLQDIGWKDAGGNRYGPAEWYSTAGASTITLTAKGYSFSGMPEQSYTLNFATGSDSACAEAPDTVTTQVLACNPQTNGTKVRFTYSNTDDSTDWWTTSPRIDANRWDNRESASLVPTFGRVLDGEQVVVEGGDSSDQYHTIFLAPGTFILRLVTDERGTQVLSNRLFIPACGTQKVPAGDPLGGPISSSASKPKVSIGKCRNHKVTVQLNSRSAIKTYRYRVVVDPKKGKTKTYKYTVSAGKSKKVVLKKQKSGTIIKVTVDGKSTKRKLSKC